MLQILPSLCSGLRKKARKEHRINGLSIRVYLRHPDRLRFSNGRSRHKHGSDQHETLPKRVSEDPRQFNFRRKQFFSARFFGLGNRFTPFWAGFGGSMEKRTSPSTSSQFFALDASIMSSVRPKIVGNVSVGALGSAMYRSNPLSATPPMRAG